MKIFKCLSCNYYWRTKQEKCLYCQKKLITVYPKKLTVTNFTEIYIPSKNHQDIPYTVCLLEDENGVKYLLKTKRNVEIGQRIESGEHASRITIGIIGTGIMGTELTKLLLERGFKVTVFSRSDESKNNFIEKLSQILSKSYSQKDIKLLLSKLTLTLSLENMRNNDILIEAIIENLRNKRMLLKQLSNILDRRVIIASCTSSLPITKIALSIKFPNRFLGWHFFNPVGKIRLVEIIPHKKTSQKVVDTIKKISQELGKVPIVSQDRPGFIVNRLLFLQINQAIKLLENNVATKENLDQAMVYGLNHPMGPLALADFIGLDTCLSVLRSIHQSTHLSEYKPAKILQELVRLGKLGKKTKEGFYTY